MKRTHAPFTDTGRILLAAGLAALPISLTAEAGDASEKKSKQGYSESQRQSSISDQYEYDYGHYYELDPVTGQWTIAYGPHLEYSTSDSGEESSWIAVVPLEQREQQRQQEQQARRGQQGQQSQDWRGERQDQQDRYTQRGQRQQDQYSWQDERRQREQQSRFGQQGQQDQYSWQDERRQRDQREQQSRLGERSEQDQQDRYSQRWQQGQREGWSLRQDRSDQSAQQYGQRGQQERDSQRQYGQRGQQQQQQRDYARQGQQQSQRGARADEFRQQRSAETRVISGEIEGFRNVQLRDRRGEQSEHTLARLKLDNGKSTVVDLGNLRQSNADLSKGDRVRLQGTIGRVDDQNVFVATNLQTEDRSYSIRRDRRAGQMQAQQRQQSEQRFESGHQRFDSDEQRSQSSQQRFGSDQQRSQWGQRSESDQHGSQSYQQRAQSYQRGQSDQQQTSIKGELESYHRIRLKGQRTPHTLVRLRMEDGESATVSLGSETSLGDLQLTQGDTVEIRGERGTVAGRDVLMARTIRVEGEKIKDKSGS